LSTFAFTPSQQETLCAVQRTTRRNTAREIDRILLNAGRTADTGMAYPSSKQTGASRVKAVTKTVFKVGDFVSWAGNGQLDLRPHFQRRPVWKSGAKSYLIDTIIRGLPIPIVFLRDRFRIKSVVTEREVVDGQQRLRTILGYIDPGLLPDYNAERDDFTITKSHNKEFAGKAFAALPSDIQRAIVGYEIPVHVFAADTEDRDVLQIFARLNATGVKLNDQELRNAEYFGIFKSLCFELAYENLNRWRDWGVFKLSEISRMTEVEEVSDYIISMHEGIHAKNKKVIDGYYSRYDAEYPESAQIARRFQRVMDTIDQTVGSDLASIAFSRRVLFGDLFVAVYHLMYQVGSKLTVFLKPASLPGNFSSKLKRLSDQLEAEDYDEEMASSLRGATAHYGTRLVRVNFILRAFGDEIEEGD
jgi:hypothetical protein